MEILELAHAMITVTCGMTTAKCQTLWFIRDTTTSRDLSVFTDWSYAHVIICIGFCVCECVCVCVCVCVCACVCVYMHVRARGQPKAFLSVRSDSSEKLARMGTSEEMGQARDTRVHVKLECF